MFRVTGNDNLDAAWSAVHDATPKGWRVGRGCVHVALMALVLAGCLPSTSAQVPPDFASFVTDAGYSFTVSAPANGTIPAAEILARLRGERGEPPYFPGSVLGQPVYGILGCVDEQACREGGVALPGNPVAVWFVPMGTSGADGWAVMDATTGVLIWPDG